MDNLYQRHDKRVLGDESLAVIFATICRIDTTSLLCDQTLVLFVVRFPSEVFDMESIYVGETAPDSRDDVLLERCVRR